MTKNIKIFLQFFRIVCKYNDIICILKVVKHIEMPNAATKNPFVIFKNKRWYWNEMSKILWGYLKSTSFY